MDEDKVMESAQWDGLHGILTNIKDSSPQVLIEQYHGLWQVEENFRLQKHDLLIRPIYHWKPRHIKAHITLVYMSFSLLRFMQHKLKSQGIKLSVERLRNELTQAQVCIVRDRKTLKRYVIPSKPTKTLKEIYRIFNKKIRRNFLSFNYLAENSVIPAQNVTGWKTDQSLFKTAKVGRNNSLGINLLNFQQRPGLDTRDKIVY